MISALVVVPYISPERTISPLVNKAMCVLHCLRWAKLSQIFHFSVNNGAKIPGRYILKKHISSKLIMFLRYNYRIIDS